MRQEVVYRTPWFQLVAKWPPQWTAPHYSIQTSDYVSVVAMAPQGLVLVRQFRPSVDGTVLELPSGHVDPGEQPEESASRELLEETGFRADRLELLGVLSPDVGRLQNRMWCYLGVDLTAVEDHRPEPGIEALCYAGSLAALLREPDFHHALHWAALFLAVRQGRLGVETKLSQHVQA
jgi:ADP-ribose pyrophosphatase